MKTVTNDEVETIISILQNYFEYLVQNPNSLLIRFFGLYSYRNVNFVVMGNIFDTQLKMSRRYDIKGSWVGRKAKDPNSIKMDQDIPFNEILFSSIEQQKILHILTKDVEFLFGNALMDYSLLVGIVDKIPNEDSEMKEIVDKKPNFNQNKYMFETITKFYFIGIIDILQKYDVSKKSRKVCQNLCISER